MPACLLSQLLTYYRCGPFISDIHRAEILLPPCTTSRLRTTPSIGYLSSMHTPHLTSYRVTPHHIPSHHITSHRITSHHRTSHHIASQNITSHHASHHITSHHRTSHRTTSHHPLRTTPHRTAPRRDKLLIGSKMCCALLDKIKDDL